MREAGPRFYIFTGMSAFHSPPARAKRTRRAARPSESCGPMRRWPRVPRLRALPRAGGCGQRVHGVEHHDEFAWLGDAASHAVSAQLAAEKEYTQLHLQPLASAEMELYGQMASSIPAESESAPEPWGSYEYYTRTPARRDLPRFCRRRRGGGGEEVLLDLGALADRHGFASLGAFAVSPNQRMLAYTLDTSGAEEWTLWVDCPV